MWYTALFERVLNMSMTAYVVILVVLAARLFLRKAPKKFSYVLWTAVLFRLLCPVSVPSPLSLLEWFAPPATEAGTIEYVTFFEHAALETPVFETVFPDGGTVRNIPVPVMELVWGSGVLAMLLYGVYSVVRTRRMTVGAVNLRENVYLADHVPGAFVTGVLRPQVYLPSALPEGEREAVILHERTHIRRLDHITRGLAYLALCLHWFNPLVWIAFFVSGTDMELSCDEAVLRKLGREVRAEYSQSILNLALGRKSLVNPLSFGGGNLKRRITNVLNYKKPKVWVLAAAAVIVLILTVVLTLNPTQAEETADGIDMSGSVMGSPFMTVESFIEDSLPEGTDFQISQCVYNESLDEFSYPFYYLLGAFTVGKEDVGYVLLGREEANDTYQLLAFEVFEEAFAEDNKIYHADVPLVMSMDGEASPENTEEVIFIDNRKYSAAKNTEDGFADYKIGNEQDGYGSGKIGMVGIVTVGNSYAPGTEIEIHYTDADGEYLAPVYTFTLD